MECGDAVPPAPPAAPSYERVEDLYPSHYQCRDEARPKSSTVAPPTIRERHLPLSGSPRENDHHRPRAPLPIAQHAASPQRETAHLPRDLPQSRDHTTEPRDLEGPTPTDPRQKSKRHLHIEGATSGNAVYMEPINEGPNMHTPCPLYHDGSLSWSSSGP